MTHELWPGGPRFRDDDGVFPLGMDAVLLAHFAKTGGARRAIDLGCGAGVIPVLLAWDNPELLIDGVEIEPRAKKLAEENAELSGFSDRVTVYNADLRDHRTLFPSGAYDLAVSNPPYFSRGSGKMPPDEALASARCEESCTLADVCRTAGYLTRWGGSFALVHRPERLADIFCLMREAGFEPKRLRFVQHKPTSKPSLVLIDGRRGGRPSLEIEAPLILTRDDGTDSDEIKMTYRRENP